MNTNNTRSREPLGRNEKNMVNLVRASPLGIISFDLDGKILFWNRAAESITGWSENDVIGFSIETFVDKSWEEFEYVRRRTLNGESFKSVPLPGTRKDGREIIISYSTAPVYDADDRIVATMAVIYDISELMRLEEELTKSLERTNRILDETVLALSSAVERRDPYTSGHQQRVAKLAIAIAEELGGTAAESQNGIWTAAILHDIGKLSVPSEILAMPRTLNRIEFDLIKTHAEVGFEILKDIEFPWPVALIVRQHHERLDGSGYPKGLKGDDILFEARILGVADAVEAMTSHRPYRPGKGVDFALEELKKGQGKIYDPAVTEACLRLFRKGFSIC